MNLWKWFQTKQKKTADGPQPVDLSPYEQAWEAARQGASRGSSGFHTGWNPNAAPMPFSMLGWADYFQPDFGDTQGVAFRIEAKCFAGRDATLYYFDDDGFPRDKEADGYLALIRELSSGLADVRAEKRECEMWGRKAVKNVIFFRLDPGAVRKTVRIGGRDAETADFGGYVFVLPRAGEFYCRLGEVRGDEMIDLHVDDFCMK